jgi:phage tail sheath protein FI
MVQYYSPGVYIEEVETGPVPIQGVATSITGAVGVTAQGPTSGKPVLVTSFADFQKTFGGFLTPPPDSQLNQWLDPVDGGSWWQFPLSVKGYFENGGQQLYVKRVFSGQARAAAGSLGQGLIADISTAAAATDTTLQLAHLFGIAKTIPGTPASAGPPAVPATPAGPTAGILVNGIPIGPSAGPPTAFQIPWYDYSSRKIGLSPAPGQALKAGRDLVVIRPLKPPTSAQSVSLKFTAQANGDWGNSIAVRVTPALGATLSILPDTVNGGPAFSGSVVSAQAVFTVMVPTAVTFNTVIINNQAYTATNVTQGAAAVPGNPAAVPPVPATPATPTTFTVTANVSDGIQSLGSNTPVIIVPANGTANVTVTSTSITPPTVVTVTLDSAFPTANPAVSHVLVQGRIFSINNLKTVNGASQFTITPDQLSYASWPANVKISSVRAARVTMVNTQGDTIDINDASQLYTNALVELDNGSAKEFCNVVEVNDTAVTFNPAPANTYLEGQKVRVLEATVNVILYNDDGSVAAQELFQNLRLSYETSTSYLVNGVNQLSKLVNVDVNAAGLWTDTTNKIFSNPNWFPTGPNGGWLTLTGGDDAMGALSVNDFVGVDGGSGNRTGIQALADIDDVSICVVPGMWSTTVQSALINFCETLKDRFAIIDPPDGLDVGGIQAFRAPYDSEYAALYYPWLVIRDPSTNQNVDLAPSAHMAGIYAQTDNTRGVFKAPANVTVAGIVLAATPPLQAGFAADISQSEQDVLNPIGINALRYFPNRGYRVWGARTLSSDMTWKYINVRRIFIYVEKSIQVGTQWVVFEPNDEGTWSRVRQSVTNFLTTFWRQGGLQGTTAKEAFFVACDLGVTMTQDDIDNGRLICQIGIAPVEPAEFVIFQIQQYTQAATTS